MAKSTSKKAKCACNVNDIRRKLKYGEINKIATQTWYSPCHVSNVLAGRRYNKEIVQAAQSITKKRK